MTCLFGKTRKTSLALASAPRSSLLGTYSNAVAVAIGNPEASYHIISPTLWGLTGEKILRKFRFLPSYYALFIPSFLNQMHPCFSYPFKQVSADVLKRGTRGLIQSLYIMVRQIIEGRRMQFFCKIKLCKKWSSKNVPIFWDSRTMEAISTRE